MKSVRHESVTLMFGSISRPRISGRTSMSALCAFAILTAAPTPAFAASQWQTSTVKTVYPLADGAFVVILDLDPVQCPGTGPGKYLYVTTGQNGVTEEGRKLFAATLLQALTTRATVSINYDDATPFCYVNRVSVSSQ